MKDINNIKFDDFYYNNHWASEYGITIGGASGVPLSSPLPTIDTQTQKIIGVHGAFITSSQYNPRTFVIPIVISDLSRIREIAGWLSNLEPSYFYYKGDSVKIKCVINDAQNDIQYGIMENLKAGITDLKFIAYDPFYELINDKYYCISTFTSKTTISNDGNWESQPIIKITGNGDVRFKLNGMSMLIKAVSTSATIDMKYFTVVNDTNLNKLSNFEGSFITFLPGRNEFEMESGNVSKVEIWCRSKFI